MTTKIEWVARPGTTPETWNPVTGCTKVSEGCRNCYAERMAKRLAGRFGYPETPNHFDVTLHPDRLEQPLRWRKPRTVFVSSMGDLFHHEVPITFVKEIWNVMAACQEHTFLVLTKRAKLMNQTVNTLVNLGWAVLPNVWGMVSVENQAAADERIPLLLQTPFAVRGVSCEPLLGAIDISPYLGYNNPIKNHGGQDGEYQAERREGLRSSASRRIGDRSTRQGMARGSQAMESLGEANGCHSLQEKAGRARYGRIPTGESNVSGAQIQCIGSPSGLSSLQWSDSQGPDNQSPERRQERQSSEKPGTGDLLRANQARIEHSKGRSDKSVGPEQCNGETHNGRSSDDSQAKGDRRETNQHSGRLPCDVSDNIQNCQGRQSLSWVICGGESGPSARPMHPDWARGLRDQCQAAGKPFFFKAWGAWLPNAVEYGCYQPDADYNRRHVLVGGTYLPDVAMVRAGKKAAGRLLDGREWNEWPK